MVTGLQGIFALLALALMFLPAVLLIYASFRIHRVVGRPAAWLLSIGALLLTLTSLDFLYSFVVALLFGPAELAAFTVVSTYALMAMRYLALLSIGFGLLAIAKTVRGSSDPEAGHA